MLQGGGALGAYQVGVYEALHEAGIEPDWVIGTSIGAINAALIAGNAPENRLARLREFWARVEQGSAHDPLQLLDRAVQHVGQPDHGDARHSRASSRRTSPAWLELAHAARHRERRLLHDGAAARDAVRARRSRALRRAQDPPHRRRRQRAQRRDALFRQPRGDARHRSRPRVRRAAAGVSRRAHRRRSVLGRRHLLQHADRGGARRQAAPGFGDLHRQHVEPGGPGAGIAVAGHGPARRTSSSRAARRATSRGRSRSTTCATSSASCRRSFPRRRATRPKAKELASWGCGTTMHVARLVAPKLDGEDHTKDIDFTPAGIRARWQAGYADTKRMVERAPWTAPVDPMDGVVIHDPVGRGNGDGVARRACDGRRAPAGEHGAPQRLAREGRTHDRALRRDRHRHRPGRPGARRAPRRRPAARRRSSSASASAAPASTSAAFRPRR